MVKRLGVFLQCWEIRNNIDKKDIGEHRVDNFSPELHGIFLDG